MDLKLKGKRALVTGSTAGIGFAIARGLAREGADVVVNGRTEGKVAEAIKRMLSDTATRVTGVAADLGSSTGVDQLLQKSELLTSSSIMSASSSPSPFLKFP